MPAALTSTSFKIGVFTAVSSAFGAGLAAMALTFTPPEDPFGGAPVFEVELFSDAGFNAPVSAQGATATRPSPKQITPSAQKPDRPSAPPTASTAEAPSQTVATSPAASGAFAIKPSSTPTLSSGLGTSASATPMATGSVSSGDGRPGAPTQGAQGGARTDSYEAQVIRWLDAHKRHPGRLEGVVTIRFEVDRRGRVRDSVVTKSSGDPRLDRIARQQLRDASPLPRPPRDVAWQTREITVSLDYRSLA